MSVDTASKPSKVTDSSLPGSSAQLPGCCAEEHVQHRDYRTQGPIFSLNRNVN